MYVCFSGGVIIMDARLRKPKATTSQRKQPLPSSNSLSFDEVFAGTRILEMVVHHLDVPSMEACRLVNKTWEKEARAALMEQCDVLLHERLRQGGPRLQKYTSWKIQSNDMQITGHESFCGGLLKDWGQEVRSLHIRGILAGWTILVRGALESWCPNLKHLHLGCAYNNPLPVKFEGLDAISLLLDRTKNIKEFEAIMNSTQVAMFQPFPIIKSLQSLRIDRDAPFYTPSFRYLS
jgi:hypothetical protein